MDCWHHASKRASQMADHATRSYGNYKSQVKKKKLKKKRKENVSIFTCPCMAVTASFTHTSPTLTCSLHERGASIISVVMSAARNTRSDKLLSLLPGDAAESRPLPASCLLPQPRFSPHVCLQPISTAERGGPHAAGS